VTISVSFKRHYLANFKRCFSRDFSKFDFGLPSVKEFAAPLTIIGIWQEKMRKFWVDNAGCS